MFYYLDYKNKQNYFLILTKFKNKVTNTISVDCFRPVKFSALLSFIIYSSLPKVRTKRNAQYPAEAGRVALRELHPRLLDQKVASLQRVVVLK